MDLYTINYIKSNPIVYSYLRENSRFYKDLNRNPEVLKYIEDLAKERYKVRLTDKIEKLSDNIRLISTFMDVLK